MYQTSEKVLNISARRAVVTVVVGCATAKSAVKRTSKLALNTTAKVAVEKGTAIFTYAFAVTMYCRYQLISLVGSEDLLLIAVKSMFTVL